MPLNRCAQRPHGSSGRQDIFAFKQAGNPGCPDRQRRQHQSTVRDRFVAGNSDSSGQSGNGVGGKGRHVDILRIMIGLQGCHTPPGGDLPSID